MTSQTWNLYPIFLQLREAGSNAFKKLRIKLETNNVKCQNYGSHLPYKTSVGKALPAGKQLQVLGDDSSQLPTRICPAGTIPCINLTPASPLLYFIFDSRGNLKRSPKWRWTGERRRQTTLHTVFLSPQTEPVAWTSPSRPSIAGSTSSCNTRPTWIFNQATVSQALRINVCNLHQPEAETAL